MLLGQRPLLTRVSPSEQKDRPLCLLALKSLAAPATSEKGASLPGGDSRVSASPPNVDSDTGASPGVGVNKRFIKSIPQKRSPTRLSHSENRKPTPFSSEDRPMCPPPSTSCISASGKPAGPRPTGCSPWRGRKQGSCSEQKRRPSEGTAERRRLLGGFFTPGLRQACFTHNTTVRLSTRQRVKRFSNLLLVLFFLFLKIKM